MSVAYKSNNSNNINCWLDAQKKESADFIANVDQKSTDAECNMEASNALIARQIEFWDKRQAVEQQDDAAYQKTEAGLGDQLKSF